MPANFKKTQFTTDATHQLNCNSYSVQNQGNTYVEVNGWVIPPSYDGINVEPPVLAEISWTLEVKFLGQMNSSSVQPDNNKVILIEYKY